MLPLARTENPPVLSPGDRSVDSIEGQWWVAHTKSRFEKAFVWDLLEKKISYFLPLVRRTHVRGGAKRTFLVPLFPSYVFFCGNRNQRTDALGTGRLCQVIDVADQSTLVQELSNLQIGLNSTGSIDRCVIPRGKWCRVIAGPLQGTKGVVVENRKVTRLVLQVSILGQGFSLEIDRDMLEPIDEDSSRPVAGTPVLSSVSNRL